jgi:hypothetical protein
MKRKIIINYDDEEITDYELFEYVSRINEKCIAESHNNWIIEKSDNTKVHIDRRITKISKIFDVIITK